MAKSAAAKAEAAVAKAEAKPTPANVAAAAKAVAIASAPPTASAKEVKQIGNAAAREVKNEVAELKNTQQLEVKALKQEEGKSAAKEEKAANKVELNTFLSGMLSGQTQPTLTAATTYAPTSQAYARVNAAYDTAQQYNLSPGKSSGDTTTGIPLHRVDTYLQSDGEKGGLVKKVLDFNGLLAQARTDGALTNAEIIDAAKEANIKKSEEKLMKQLENKGYIRFGDTSGDNVNYATTMFQKDPATGSYVVAGTDKYAYDAPSQSGLGALGSLIGAGLAWWNPLGWSALAAGAAGGAVGGGLSTGTLEGALKGGLLGGIGGGAMDYLNSTGMFQPSGWEFGPGNMTADQLAALQAGGVNTSGWTPDAWDLFSGAGAQTQPSGWDFGPMSDTAMSYANQLQSAGMSAADAATLGVTLADQGFTAAQVGGIVQNMTPTLATQLSNAANAIKTGLGLGSAATGAGGAADAAGTLAGAAGTVAGAAGGLPWGNILGTGAGLLGSYLTGQSAQEAADKQAETQLKIAEMMRFKPVGVSTRFGTSQFGYDSTGRLTSAGYTLAPDIKAQQDQLMAASGGMLGQFTGSQAATAPMGDAAQRMMSLGQGYLATSPQEQAAKYLAEQEALLAPGNAAEYAALQNKLAQQGRLGLSVGGEAGMMATNPELAAYQNKLEMQRRQLTAAATQGGQQYAQFGAGLVGSGGNMLRDMYSTQSAAYSPYQTALGGAQNLEALGRSAMDIGTQLGAQQSTANQPAANPLIRAWHLGSRISIVNVVVTTCCNL